MTKMCEDNLSLNKCTQKVADTLTFDLSTQSSTWSSLSSSTVRIWSLYIEIIHSYCTRNNGLFKSQNDIDFPTGALKLYVCLPVVL